MQVAGVGEEAREVREGEMDFLVRLVEVQSGGVLRNVSCEGVWVRIEGLGCLGEAGADGAGKELELGVVMFGRMVGL